jgi:hypothetical protein
MHMIPFICSHQTLETLLHVMWSGVLLPSFCQNLIVFPLINTIKLNRHLLGHSQTWLLFLVAQSDSGINHIIF